MTSYHVGPPRSFLSHFCSSKIPVQKPHFLSSIFALDGLVLLGWLLLWDLNILNLDNPRSASYVIPQYRYMKDLINSFWPTRSSSICIILLEDVIWHDKSHAKLTLISKSRCAPHSKTLGIFNHQHKTLCPTISRWNTTFGGFGL